METLSENRSVAETRLSHREIEVLSLILEGQSSKEVANALCCTKRTVDFHLSNAYRKLQVSNRIQAMRRMASMGMLNQPKELIRSSV